MSDPEGLNAKVYTWAASHMGQHIGRGECWDLADQALNSAGAASSTTTGKNDDYVWGAAVGLHQVSAGDILQLRDHVMTVKTTTSVTFEDGSGYDSSHEEVHRRPHHTAIVVSYKAPNEVVVLEQHVKPLGERVQRHVLALASTTTPTVETSYRSMKDKQGRMRNATVVVTTTVKVTGKIWAYRPVAKAKKP